MEKIFLMSNPRRKTRRRKAVKHRKRSRARRSSGLKLYRNPRRISSGASAKVSFGNIAKMVLPVTAGITAGFLVPSLLKLDAKFKIVAPAGLGIAFMMFGRHLVGRTNANLVGGGLLTASALMLIDEYIMKPKGMSFLSLPTSTRTTTALKDDMETLNDIAMLNAEGDELSDISNLSAEGDELSAEGDELASAYYNRYNRYDE